jgi:hypothetical protein
LYVELSLNDTYTKKITLRAESDIKESFFHYLDGLNIELKDIKKVVLSDATTERDIMVCNNPKLNEYSSIRCK